MGVVSVTFRFFLGGEVAVGFEAALSFFEGFAGPDTDSAGDLSGLVSEAPAAEVDFFFRASLARFAFAFSRRSFSLAACAF